MSVPLALCSGQTKHHNAKLFVLGNKEEQTTEISNWPSDVSVLMSVPLSLPFGRAKAHSAKHIVLESREEQTTQASSWSSDVIFKHEVKLAALRL